MRFDLKTTRWSGTLLAGVLLSSYVFGACLYVVVCPESCCGCGDDTYAGYAGAPSGELGSCGIELVSRTVGKSQSNPTADGAGLAQSREEPSPRLSRSGPAQPLGEPAPSKPDVLYLLHASLLI